MINFLCRMCYKYSLCFSRNNCINTRKCHDFSEFKLTELQNLTLVSRRLESEDQFAVIC